MTVLEPKRPLNICFRTDAITNGKLAYRAFKVLLEGQSHMFGLSYFQPKNNTEKLLFSYFWVISPFLAHLSRRLKWAFLITISPVSVVVVVVVVVQISQYHLLLQNHWANLIHTNYPWLKGIQVCSNEGPRPFPRGDNNEIAKIHWQILKIIISRTTGPILTKFWTNHIKFEQMERPNIFTTGDNNKIARVHSNFFKISSSWTTGPI